MPRELVGGKGPSVRTRRYIAFLAALACVALAAAPAAAEPPGREPEAHGLATPDGEAWGDEWFDEAAAARAREIERRMIEEAGGAAARAAAPAPSAPPAPAAVEKPKERGFVPPRHGPADLEAAWRARREALLRQDLATARAAEARIERLRAELDLRELHAFAAATVRESRKLEASAPAEAVERAELAVRLAPSLPSTHRQLLRARFAHDPFDVAGLLDAGAAAIEARLRDPRAVRLLVLDLCAALGAAILAAGGVVLLFLTVARARRVLHDFHHLFPRSVSRVQTGLLLCMLLALPPAFGFGPVVAAALLLAALWLYLERGERIALGAWLTLASLLPAGAGILASQVAWDDTPAAALYAVDRAGDFTRLQALQRQVQDPDAAPETLFVVARARKRLGDLEEARSLYERALEKEPRWPEALINLGNVHFLRGDLAKAEELYTKAIDLAPGIAAAYFDLSRVHYDRVDFTLGQAARSKAVELDPALVQRYAANEDGVTPANQYVLDVPLSDASLAAVAARSGEPARIEAQLGALLLGPVPEMAAPFLGGAVVLLLAVGGGLLAGRTRPAGSCPRCGRPVCGACDPESVGGNLCGQCINVFTRKAAVDASVREQKERAIKGYETRAALWARTGGLLLAGPFLAGSVGRGSLLLCAGWFLVALAAWPAGLARPVFEGTPLAWKLAFVLPPLAGLCFLSWRGARGAR